MNRQQIPNSRIDFEVDGQKMYLDTDKLQKETDFYNQKQKEMAKRLGFDWHFENEKPDDPFFFHTYEGDF